MPARHYNSQYNINGGPWLPGNFDEVPGPNRQITVAGLAAGTYAVKVRGVDPATSEVTLQPSNECIMQVGQPSISEPVQTVAESVVTLAEVVQRRDALLAAAGVVVSSQDAQVMNEALVAAAGASATVSDNLGIQANENVTSYADVSANVTAVQVMLEQVVAAVTAAATVSDTFTAAGDTTAPTVTAFTAGTPSGSTVPITTFTATDAVGVTGYLITESATPPLPGAAGWGEIAPSSYTATGSGSVTLYAWAKDAAGNVSAAATQTVTIAAGGPVTLSFETASIVDSTGFTWTPVVPTAVSDYGTVGSITSGVSGGDSGNCLKIVQSQYNDGYENYYALDTYITRTMSIGAGTISLKVKRGDSFQQAFISIDGVVTYFGTTTVGEFVAKTVNVSVQKNNVVVKIGFTAGTDAGVNGYIDSVSIPGAV